MRIALAVIARNEENTIGRCLSSAMWADEIVVVDTGSTDRTKEIARSFGAKVFDFEWCDDFAKARNYSLECVTADWTLVLDADEWVESVDLETLYAFMKCPEHLGRIQLVDETVVEGEREEVRNFITRFFPSHLRYKGRIHEQVDSIYPRENLALVARHDGYLGSTKARRNIPLLLKEIEQAPSDPYFHYQIAKEYRGVSEWSLCEQHFRHAYLGLTGSERFAPNVVVDYLYVLRKINQFERGLRIIQTDHSWVQRLPDYHFVCGLFYLDLMIQNPTRYIGFLPLIESCYSKCLNIGETDEYDSMVGTGSYAALYNLGNYYEVLGKIEMAVDCYSRSEAMGFTKAKHRLQGMLRSDPRDNDA